MRTCITMATILLIATSCKATSEEKGVREEEESNMTISAMIGKDPSYELDAGGSSEAIVFYEQVEFEVGTTKVSEGYDRPIKHQFLGLGFMSGSFDIPSFGRSDISEYALRVRHYYDEGGASIPFFSFALLFLVPDSTELDSGFGLRVGAGIEYPVGSHIALSLSGDYLWASSSPDDPYDSMSIDYDIVGLSFRFGISFMF